MSVELKPEVEAIDMPGEYEPIKPDWKDKFVRPKRINNWAIVILSEELIIKMRADDYDRRINNFVRNYTARGREKGIDIGNPKEVICVPDSPSATDRLDNMDEADLKSKLREIFASLSDKSVGHALIITPKKIPFWLEGYIQYLEAGGKAIKPSSAHPLMRVSMMFDTDFYPLAGRNITNEFALRMIPILWRRINYLLGGVNIDLKGTFEANHIPQCLDGRSLIVCIDKCELLPEDVTEPMFDGLEISATLGMWDIASDKLSFRTQVAVQASQNAISDIHLLFKDIIRSFRMRKDGQLPTNIIIFRRVTFVNEISEPQYLKIFQQEWDSIKKQLANDYGKSQDASPSLTYLIIPWIRKQSAPKGKEYFQFPQVLKLKDENNFTPASIQAMFCSLNFLSPTRDTRSWSVTADLAYRTSARARYISAGWLEDNRGNYSENRERMIEDLNRFLMEEMGDENYRNTLPVTRF